MENNSSKGKVVRLFQFLKQYNNIKNPIVTDIKNQIWLKWMDDLPRHENIVNNIYNDSSDEDVILSIKRPILKDCPKLPEPLGEWVEKGWNELEKEVIKKNEIKVRNEVYSGDENEEEFITVKFEDDDNRIKEFNQWKSKRDQWAAEEKPSRVVDELFNQFYALYANIKKEAESVELLIGDGILLSNNGVTIEHPILLQNVKLDFDADVPEFILTPGDKGTELYRSLFYNFNEINDELIKGIYNDFESSDYSPIEVDNTSSFLNRVANALSAKGKFINSRSEVEKGKDFPQIYRRPVLFLRKRNLGFGIAIDSIIEDINGDKKIPAFLNDVVGNIENENSTTCNEGIKDNLSNLNPNGIDEDILLTKPANSEQLAVAKYLERNGAVLVQGPPGTGKTHTIANMVGHLLSEGKNILITSYSEKALSVLKEKVAEDLQSLCLSLLSTTEGRQEMERTLDEINENRSKLDPNDLARQIETLEGLRKEEISKLNTLRAKLKNSRLNEYRPIVVGGEEFKPVEAAKYIKENKDKHSWIPEPVTLGALPSLSEEEINELYKTNVTISKEEEKEYACRLPEVQELLKPIEFNNLIHNKNKFSEQKLNEHINYWNRNNSYTIDELNNLISDLNKALDYISLDKEWTLATIEAAKEEAVKQQWVNLVDEINYVYKMSIDASEQILKYNPEFIGKQQEVDIKKQLQDIIAKIEHNGKITRLNLLFNSDMKTTINLCRVNGAIPKALNEFKALLSFHNLSLAKNRLKLRWNRQIAPLGAEDTETMGDNFENTCKKYCNVIEENMRWYQDQWEPILKRIKAYGANIDALDNKIDLSSDKFSSLKFIKGTLGESLIAVIKSEIYRLDYDKYKDSTERLANIISEYSGSQSSVIVSGLQQAIINNDSNLYSQFYECLVNINEVSPIIERRRELLNRLKATAPEWAKEIELRAGIHGNDKTPDNIKEAWLYSQFNEEIRNRNNTSIEKIQNEILNVEKIIKDNTAQLAFKKAWRAKLTAFQNNKKQIQAIEGWRQVIRKIGSGKGKRAETLKVEARRLMPECQSAVPVWIMSLSKVVENFNPSENKFDVVIIDEASQADVMGLVALYLGKQIIVVGDNEQVSPLAIGERSEDIDRLIKEYLYDIPNRFLYSGKFSIYDLAQTSGYQPIRLKEHFRCVPEIIQYSNILSYNRQIKPLRDASEVATKPHVVTYKVEEATTINKTNEKEAEAIAALILACCEKEEYKNKSFGVITLRGEKQALLIDRLLQSKMEPAEYRKREILCGNSANFQGDERDIIFLSMVDTNDGNGPLRLNGYGTDNLYKKRYNVAVSRAKDQIWLVHSIDSENDLKPGDIRKELLDYFKNPSSKDNEYNLNVVKAESEFEKRVMRYLIDKGYKIIPQWEVGAYRIDMVAVYKDKKVAIECDGEKWHDEDKFEEDMNRQAILERLGWRFIRIRGSEFFKDELGAMERVYKKLNDMEIFCDDSEVAIEHSPSYGLKEKVIARGDEILREWDSSK